MGRQDDTHETGCNPFLQAESKKGEKIRESELNKNCLAYSMYQSLLAD